MSKYLLLVSAFGKQIQKHDLVQSDETFKKLYYRSKKLVKLSIESIFRMFLSYIFNNVPTGEFLCLQKCNGTQANSHVNKCHELKAFRQSPDSFPSHSAPLHSRSIKQGSKDYWHLVETWPISHCIFNKEWVEKRPTSEFPLAGWIFSQVLPAIWVLLYSQTSFKQF